LDDASKRGVNTLGDRGMSPRKVPDGLADKLTTAASGFAVSFDDIGMDDIATASGIPRATLYYYFAGKNDVLAFLLESMLDDLRISVSTALDVEGDTRTRLQALVRAQLAHLAANPAAAQLLLMNLGRAGRLGVIASGIEAGFYAPVRQILTDGIDTGELADIDIDVTATAMYGAVTIVGLRSLVTTGGIDVDTVAANLFPVFWSGIAAPRPSARRSRR
jgi:TetR/AcrR family transcriptional regulator